MADRREPSFRAGWIAAAVVAVVAVVAMLAVREDDLSRLTFCNAGAGVGHAALLFDATKVLDAGTAAGALRDIGAEVDAGVELRVHALIDNADALRSLGTLCRPYHADALNVAAAKDDRAGARDCDDLPAQLAPDVRTAAARYCAERAALAVRLEALTRPPGRVEGAHLMESMAGLLRTPDAPSTLFVVSDMLQHASWYSHLDLDWTEWGFDEFRLATDAPGTVEGVTPRPGLRIRVFYVPRRGLTDSAQTRDKHWSFWRGYFDGADLAFHEREVAPGYAAETRMDLEAAIADVVRQRQTTAQQIAEAERELRVVSEETAALGEAGRTAQAAVDDLARRVTTIRRARIAAEAERRKLQAEWAALAPAEVAVETVPTAPKHCALRLLAPFGQPPARDRYVNSGEANYGAGTVVVRYAVGAAGQVLTSSAHVDRTRSAGSRAEHLGTLADDAVDALAGWRFAVECDRGAAIGEDGQPATATFTYREKCVGAPIPRCRTVFDGATTE